MTMRFGAAMFCTDYSMAPAPLARALEARGFESLWLPEHSHIPSSRASPWPQGGDLPKKYYDVIDPFVGLATAATATEMLRLGTGICLVVQRDPIQTAKMVATLDLLSGGRFLFGIGAGWNAEEMADHGTAFESRFEVMAERVAAMRAIWTETEPAYRGKFVEIPRMMTWPKPVQRPHPPVIVGGEFPHGARRALEYGDGWAPHAHRPDYALADVLPRFWEMAAAAGRGPAEVPVSVFGAGEDAGEIGRYVENNAARVVFNLPSAEADEVLPVLDRQAALIERFAEA
jgi:probable F420-dependent oxidoreductase